MCGWRKHLGPEGGQNQFDDFPEVPCIFSLGRFLPVLRGFGFDRILSFLRFLAKTLGLNLLHDMRLATIYWWRSPDMPGEGVEDRLFVTKGIVGGLDAPYCGDYRTGFYLDTILPGVLAVKEIGMRCSLSCTTGGLFRRSRAR